jgi:tetrahydromethanopterin S-methyltransferase subunit G
MDKLIEVLNKLGYIADSILNWTVKNIGTDFGIVVGIVLVVLAFILLRQWATNLSVVLGRFFTTKYDTPGRPLKVKSLGTGYLLANAKLSSFKLDKKKARDLYVSKRSRVW